MAQGRYNEPFFWHRLVNVGWATDGVVIVQVTAPEIKAYQVVVLDPAEWFDDNFGGSTITYEDYREAFILNLGTSTGVGTVVTEDELTDIWIWDGFTIGALGDDFTAEIAAGTAAFGYAPNIHTVGEQVAHNTEHFPGGPPRLGDYVIHTHPNGSTTLYSNGFTALSAAYTSWHGPSSDFIGYVIRPSDPNGFPEPPQDLTNTEAYYWRRITTRAEQTAAILRRSFLVNFAKDFTRLAELQDFTMSLASPLEWSVKGYAAGTEFTIADSIVTPIGGVVPKFEDAGSVAGSHSGTIKRFNSSGFVI